MKKFIYKSTVFSGIVAALLTLGSCSDVLNEEPFSEIPSSDFYKTNSDAIAGVAAIYDGFQSIYGNNYFKWGEFRGDSYIFASAGDVNNLTLLNNTIQPSNGSLLNWGDLYATISRANLAIEKIPTIPGYDQNLLAQAYIARAYLYFDAVRIWGAVPVFTEFVTILGDDLVRPATDGATILTDIVVPDMLTAEQLMVGKIDDVHRFSKASIWAFHSTVYKWLGQYAEAKVALDKIVALGEYSLVTDRESWQKLFLNDPNNGGKLQTGPELIFTIDFDVVTDNSRSAVFKDFFAGIPSFTRSPLLNQKWLSKFPVDEAGWVLKYPDFTPQGVDELGGTLWGDWRYFDTWENPLTDDTQIHRVAKYTKTNYSPSVDDTDLIVYRYSGILLSLAEVENQLNPNDFTKAISLVNEIRVARQLPTVDAIEFTTQDEVLNFILDEKQLEQVGEGQRWWDLRTARKAVEVMAPINGQTEATLVFPYFQGHLITNPSLVQNQ